MTKVAFIGAGSVVFTRNLLGDILSFPELRPEDFLPWVDPDEAGRQGLTREQFAARTAEQMLHDNATALYGLDSQPSNP